MSRYKFIVLIIADLVSASTNCIYSGSNFRGFPASLDRIGGPKKTLFRREEQHIVIQSHLFF